MGVLHSEMGLYVGTSQISPPSQPFHSPSFPAGSSDNTTPAC